MSEGLNPVKCYKSQQIYDLCDHTGTVKYTECVYADRIHVWELEHSSLIAGDYCTILKLPPQLPQSEDCTPFCIEAW